MTEGPLTIQLEGMEALTRKLGNKQIILRPVAKMISDLALLVQREARSGAPRDTGALGRSIMREVQPLMARVFTGLQYAPVMEYGRHPGGRMPPPQALAGWARRHGFGTSAGALFVLARSIARRGIKGRFFMKKATDAGRNALPRLVSQAVASMEGEWRK
jgi:hypothetical protein